MFDKDFNYLFSKLNYTCTEVSITPDFHIWKWTKTEQYLVFFSWNWNNYPDSLEFHMLTIFLVASVYMAENKLITVHRFLLSNGKQIPTRNIYFLFLYNLHIVIWHSALKSEKRQKCNGYQSINYSSQIFDFLNNLVMCSKIWKKTKVNVMAVKKLITVHRFLIFIQFA